MKKGNRKIIFGLLGIFLLLVGMYVYHMNTLREGTFSKLTNKWTNKMGKKYDFTNIDNLIRVLTPGQGLSTTNSKLKADSIEFYNDINNYLSKEYKFSKKYDSLPQNATPEEIQTLKANLLTKAEAIRTFDRLGPKYDATNINDIIKALTDGGGFSVSNPAATKLLDSIQILLGIDNIPPLMPENYGVAPGREEIRARKALLFEEANKIATREINNNISTETAIRKIVNDSTPGQGVSTSNKEVSVKDMNDLAEVLNLMAERLGLDPPIQNELSSTSTKQQIIDFKAQINAEANKLLVQVDKNIMKLVDFSKMTPTNAADLLNKIAEDLGIGERLTLDLNRLSTEDISRVIDRLTRELESVYGSPKPVPPGKTEPPGWTEPPGRTEPPGEFETGPIKGPIKTVDPKTMLFE